MSEIPKIGTLIGIAVLLRWATSYHPHSGEGKPPIYGDYEAQRHWQEITLHLPIEQWYRNTSDNDLQYWGLDYPPLTAYHSLVLGRVANSLNASFVELRKSRGIETPDHKHFMRLTVLVADLLIYIPAVVAFFCTTENSERNSKGEGNVFGLKRLHLFIFTALIYPGIYLIDHGHFQYNSVSLGFFVLAVTAIFGNSPVFASFFFVLALNYKQMELYHALPFFFYILGICNMRLRRSSLSSLRLLLGVTFTVLVTFFVIWAPFIQKWPAVLDVLIRLFPVDRGVFEDKVANVWCSLNVLVKLKEIFHNFELAKICFLTTLIAVLPCNADLFFRPTKEKFLLSLINTATGFYLFSFQVHEKSILLVAVPVLLYLHKDQFFCFWFLLISTFSMVPLLIKDGLFAAYGASMVFYWVSANWALPDLLDTSKLFFAAEKSQKSYAELLIKFLFYISVVGMITLSLSSVMLEPPNRYPDLFPLLVSVYSCAHFCLFICYFNLKQFLLVSKKMKMK